MMHRYIGEVITFLFYSCINFRSVKRTRMERMNAAINSPALRPIQNPNGPRSVYDKINPSGSPITQYEMKATTEVTITSLYPRSAPRTGDNSASANWKSTA